jgi:hypothetical protein
MKNRYQVVWNICQVIWNIYHSKSLVSSTHPTASWLARTKSNVTFAMKSCSNTSLEVTSKKFTISNHLVQFVEKLCQFLPWLVISIISIVIRLNWQISSALSAMRWCIPPILKLITSRDTNLIKWLTMLVLKLLATYVEK